MEIDTTTLVTVGRHWGPEVDDGMDVDRCMDEPPPSFATEQAQRPLLSGGD
jgi:hypothetical protein